MQSDLISRLSDLRSQYNLFDEVDYNVYHTLTEAIEVLYAQPQIVRCEECEHKMECYGDVIMKSRGGGVVYRPLEYCSEGKRKDE